MYDMAEKLTVHISGNLDAAWSAYSAQVVSGQVHQHKMLAFFLRIVEQLSFKLLILFPCLAAAAGSCNRPYCRKAVPDTHQAFRGASQELPVAEIDEEQIWRRVE